MLYGRGVLRENIKPQPYLTESVLCCKIVYLSSKKMTKKLYQPVLYLTTSYDLLASFHIHQLYLPLPTSTLFLPVTDLMIIVQRKLYNFFIFYFWNK